MADIERHTIFVSMAARSGIAEIMFLSVYPVRDPKEKPLTG